MKPIASFILLFGLVLSSCQSQSGNGATLDAAAFNTKLTTAKNAVIIDVRTPSEFSEGIIAGAENIDYNSDEFEKQINALDKNKPYYVYCLSGARSGSAANYMRDNGFKEVYDMKSGLLAWNRLSLPLTRNTAAPADKMSSEQYASAVASAPVVLVDFYAPWCAPCREMEPMLQQVAYVHAGKLVLVRINIDESKGLAKQLGVQDIPIIKLFRDGKEVWSHKGLISKAELEKVL